MHFWIQLWLPQIWADISVNLSRVFFGQKTRDHHSLLWLHFGRGNAWQKDLSSRLYPAAWQNLNLKQIENFKGELWFCTYFLTAISNFCLKLEQHVDCNQGVFLLNLNNFECRNFQRMWRIRTIKIHFLMTLVVWYNITETVPSMINGNSKYIDR